MRILIAAFGLVLALGSGYAASLAHSTSAQPSEQPATSVKVAAICGAGWEFKGVIGNFTCVPIKPKISCPANTTLVQGECFIGCRPNPK